MTDPKPNDEITAACTCEHVSHFEGDTHEYGAEFNVEDITQVRTDFGMFTVCVQCAETCLRDHTDTTEG